MLLSSLLAILAVPLLMTSMMMLLSLLLVSSLIPAFAGIHPVLAVLLSFSFLLLLVFLLLWAAMILLSSLLLLVAGATVVACVTALVSSKQTKINFGSNRNKPKQDLFRVCFGLFRETKNKLFLFVSVFRTYIETTVTNRIVSKQTEKTEKNAKNQKNGKTINFL
jgi:hypothetical protein